MADEEEKKDEAAEEGGGGGSVLPWLVVGILGAAGGGALPFILPPPAATDAAEEVAEEVPEEASYELPADEEKVYVPFDEKNSVVVNLNEGNLTRFLRIAVTMEIALTEEEEFKKRLETKRALLRNWLLATMADKELDEIRGAVGQNRLRREIRDQFNTVMYPEGYDKIYDVLFDEFNVQ